MRSMCTRIQKQFWCPLTYKISIHGKQLWKDFSCLIHNVEIIGKQIIKRLLVYKILLFILSGPKKDFSN